jgi:hypothetical protein
MYNCSAAASAGRTTSQPRCQFSQECGTRWATWSFAKPIGISENVISLPFGKEYLQVLILNELKRSKGGEQAYLESR